MSTDSIPRARPLVPRSSRSDGWVTPDFAVSPAARRASLTLDDRERRIHELEKWVACSDTETELAFAQQHIRSVLGDLRMRLTKIRSEAGDTCEIERTIVDNQRKLDIVSGREVNHTARYRLITEAYAAHADDRVTLLMERTGIARYREDKEQEFDAAWEPWRDSIGEQHGLDGVIRVNEWRQKYGVSDQELPFGDPSETTTDGQGRALSELRKNLGLPETSQMYELVPGETQAVEPSREASLEPFAPRLPRPVVRKTIDERRKAVAEAYEALEQREAEGEVAALINELEIQAARDDVIAREDEFAAALANVQTSIERGILLTGDKLIASYDLISAEVARGQSIVKDRTGAEPRVFARRRIENAMCETRSAIQGAVPASDEKEQLQIYLASLDEDYAMLTSSDANPVTIEALIARISVENSVDTEWLRAQQAELAKVATGRTAQPAISRPHSMSR
jgi:hypothetical protein